MRRPRLRSRFSSRIRSRISVLLLLWGALLAVPGGAAAQNVSTEAAAAFDQGTQYFGEGKYDLALESFRTAYRLRAHPAILLNIATCLDRLGRPIEAVTEYHRYRRLRGSGIEPERRRFVEEALRRLRPQVALLFVTLPSPDAAVRVDGQVIEIGEDPLVVWPGRHTIESRAPDGRYTRTEVTGVGGQVHDVALRFPGPPAGPGPERPGPAPAPRVAAGPGPAEQPPPPAPGPAPSPAPVEHTRSGWDPSLRWIGLGATAVFGGLMLFTASRTLALADEYDRTDDPDVRDEGQTYQAVTEFVFFPATMLAAGFTVLAFVFAADDDERPPATGVALSLSPDHLVLGARGTF